MTFESDYDAVLIVKARRDRLDQAITVMAADSEFTPLVRRLGCLRGIGDLTGLALAVEIDDWHRFTSNTIGSFVGLVPSEYSSGQSKVQGSITKTGNTHVRRLLVEAAMASPRPLRRRQDDGNSPHQQPEHAPMLGTTNSMDDETPSANARSGTSSPASPSPVNWPAGAGRWLSWTTDQQTGFVHQVVEAARGAIRDSAMSSPAR